MKYVCLKTCQLRINGHITFCEKGEIYNLKEANQFFRCIEEKVVPDYKIDFIKASEAELKGAKWKFDDAFKAIKEHFDVELDKEEGTRKSDVIKQILDARYRALNTLKMPAE